jgi:hypothetical protein
MGDQKFIISSRRYAKKLVSAAFAVIRTHQPALGPRGGLWLVLLMCTHKEGLCPSSGNINRLLMMMMINRYKYPLKFQGGLKSGRRPRVKTIAESLSKHDENMMNT